MPTKTKLSNRKTDLANHDSVVKTDPLDTATIVLDAKKMETLTKSLPRIKKIKKEKVEVESSVTTTSAQGIKTKSLDEMEIDPNDFLNLDEGDSETQVRSQCEFASIKM